MESNLEYDSEIGGDECGELLPGDENLPLAGHAGADMPDLSCLPEIPYDLGHSTSIDGVTHHEGVGGYAQNEFGINPSDDEIMEVLGKGYLSQRYLCQAMRDLFSDCWGGDAEWARVLERWANQPGHSTPGAIDFGRASVPHRIQHLIRRAQLPQTFAQGSWIVNREDETAAVVDLGALALRFGRTDRITYHEDGRTPESDSDHTVMLGWVACAFAANHDVLGLDLGLVAQYALVHDIVEAYVGDTPTLQIPTEASKAVKAAREAGGARTLRDQFASRLPWIVGVLESYEERQTPEARYVKAMDKLLPKITHALNNGVTVFEQGMDRAELIKRWDVQAAELLEYAGDFPQLFDLRYDLLNLVLDRLTDPGATEPR